MLFRACAGTSNKPRWEWKDPSGHWRVPSRNCRENNSLGLGVSCSLFRAIQSLLSNVSDGWPCRSWERMKSFKQVSFIFRSSSVRCGAWLEQTGCVRSLQDIETLAADGEAGQSGWVPFCMWVSGEWGHHWPTVWQTHQPFPTSLSVKGGIYHPWPISWSVRGGRTVASALPHLKVTWEQMRAGDDATA